MSNPRLHVLDVGHGNSAVLIDDESVVVFDAGPKTSLLEFLNQENVTEVNTVLVSHADQDHVEGLVSLLESGTVSIGAVRLNTDLVKKTAVWSDLIYLLNKKNKEGKVDFDVALTTKNSGQFDTKNVEIQILAPSLAVAGSGVGTKRNNKRMVTSNGISAVIRLICHGQPRVLLCGDVNSDGFREMLKDCPVPYAPVVIYPHHGGHSEDDDVVEFAKEIVNATSAKTVIFSIGRGLHDTPIPEAVEELRRLVPEIRVACTQLSEHCSPHLPSDEPSHLNDLYAAGRERRQCCAGTITVQFTEPEKEEVTPQRDNHIAFIEMNCSTPLCRKPHDEEADGP